MQLIICFRLREMASVIQKKDKKHWKLVIKILVALIISIIVGVLSFYILGIYVLIGLNAGR